MKIRGSFPLLLALALAVGCQDESAKSRAEAQDVLTQASRRLALATIAPGQPGDEAFDKTRQALESIIRDLSALRDAEDGQQAAAALLSATAHKKLAGLRLATAQQIEAANRQRLAMARSHVDAALRLDAVASGQESIDTTDERATLDGERREAERRLGEFSARMAELDGPISQRERENERDAREASRLDGEATVLKRDANEQGHSAGLGSYLKALDLEREADRYEYRIAHRDNDLEYELRPEHQLADYQATSTRTLIGDIDGTRSLLDEGQRVRSRRVEEVRAMIEGEEGLRARIDAVILEVRQSITGELETLYEEALSHLGKAETSANRAVAKSPRGQADAARVASARVYEEIGQLHLTRARGLSDQEILFDRLVAAGDTLGSTAGFRDAAAAARATGEEAIDAAKAALTEAREQLGKVNDRDLKDEVDAFKSTLDRSLGQLSGAAPRLALTMPPGSAASSGSVGARQPTAGAETPEALIETLKQIHGANEIALILSITAPPDASSGLSPAETRLANQVIGMMRGMADLQDALQTTFERNISDLAAGSPMLAGFLQIPGVTDARLENVTGGSGSVSITSETGETETRSIISIGGRWYLDVKDDLADMTGVDPSAADTEIDPAVLEGMIAGIGTMMEGMGKLFRGLAGDVRSGALTSIEDVGEAAQTRLMEMAQLGGLGGGPGGGPGGP